MYISVEFEVGRYRRIAAITYCEFEVEPLLLANIRLRSLHALEREKNLILIRDGCK